MHSTPDPTHVRFSGPLARFAAGLAEELARLGYTATSAVAVLQLAAHLSRWLDSQDIGLGDVSGRVIERFLAARRVSYTSHYSLQALDPVLGYLRGEGLVPVEPVPMPSSPVETLLARYRLYLVDDRGLSGPVADAVPQAVRVLLRLLEDDHQGGPAGEPEPRAVAGPVTH